MYSVHMKKPPELIKRRPIKDGRNQIYLKLIYSGGGKLRGDPRCSLADLARLLIGEWTVLSEHGDWWGDTAPPVPGVCLLGKEQAQTPSSPPIRDRPRVPKSNAFIDTPIPQEKKCADISKRTT